MSESTGGQVEGYDVESMTVYRSLDLHAGEVVYVVKVRFHSADTSEETGVQSYFVGYQDLLKLRDQINATL